MGSLRLYTNFFQPTMCLVFKTSHGARVHNVYDTAETPYQRLLESGLLRQPRRVELAATHHRLNPVRLLSQTNANVEQLWKMAERPTAYMTARGPKGNNGATSVTGTVRQ
jgi:hypothetical protein